MIVFFFFKASYYFIVLLNTVAFLIAVSHPQSYIQKIRRVILLIMCWYHWQWVSVSWVHPLICGDSWSFLQQCLWARFGFQFPQGLYSWSYLDYFPLLLPVVSIFSITILLDTMLHWFFWVLLLYIDDCLMCMVSFLWHGFSSLWFLFMLLRYYINQSSVFIMNG